MHMGCRDNVADIVINGNWEMRRMNSLRDKKHMHNAY